MSAKLATTRILVCEDSATYAASLVRFLEQGQDIEVVGVCATGEETLKLLPQFAPDLVTLDLELPGMGGLETIRAIMRSHPTPVVVLSAHVQPGSQNAAAALAAGAVEALPKTRLRFADLDGPAAVALRFRLRRLATARVGRVHEPPERRPSPPYDDLARGASAVGICGSTGGPHALEVILSELSGDFPLPILVVQHIARGFIDGFVSWLGQRVELPVAIARDGEHATPGVWFAPDDAHLVLAPSMKLALDRETDVGPHRPSCDVLLTSLARTVGARSLGVVLTGMGRDGGRGVAAIRQAGGCVIAQDERTSVVFGMPKVAIEQGANVVLPLEEIAGALRSLRVSGALA